jgi:hypothetical protein
MRAGQAELLFLLPEPVAAATVLAGAESWLEPLRAAGVEIVDADRRCDLVVAPVELLVAAAGCDAPALLLTGHVPRRQLRKAGLRGQRFMPIPSLEQPSYALPLDRPRLARYVLLKLSAPPTRVKVLRNRALALAIRLGVKLPHSLTLAFRNDALPQLVGATHELGLPERLEYVLALGRATERGSFHLFQPGARRPSWIAKFDRGPIDQIEPPTDAEGLRLIAETGGEVAAHAPHSYGVAEVGGRPLVVESVAPGAPLVNVLRAPRRFAGKRKLVEAVASWLVDLGSASLGATEETDPLRGLQVAEKLASELEFDLDEIRRRVAGLPTVLEHGDVGLEHVLADGSSFVVIDWELARAGGMPLHDLAFFLSQALPVLNGEVDDPRFGRREAFARLFRGESPSSPLLFASFARACEAWGIPKDAVPALVSVTWLRIAEVDVRRHFAEVWFSDPELGLGWSAWQRLS